MILSNDHPIEASARNEAEGPSGDGDTRYIERDASLHNTFTTSELASKPHGVPSTPVQAQPQTIPNPPGYRKIRPISKGLKILLEARQ